MKYEEFVDVVMDYVAKSGAHCEAVPDYDEEQGMYIVRLSDGTVITGNSCSLKLTVRWPSGHQAQCSVAV